VYFNVFGKRVSRAQHREMLNAARNRRELIAAQFSRRDLIKMGLITSAGLLAPIKGLSARRSPGSNSVCVPSFEPASPKTRAFIEPLQIMRIAQPVPRLDPAPTIEPNRKAGEGRTRDHQAFKLFPPTKLYNVSQHEAHLSMSPDPARASRRNRSRACGSCDISSVRNLSATKRPSSVSSAL
jgi:hypothetical protein